MADASLAIDPLGPGARKITDAPRLLEARPNPFTGSKATTPKEWRAEWSRWIKANRAEWEGEQPVPLPEGPVRMGTKARDHMKMVAKGENPALHFEAAVRTRELLEQSVLAKVEAPRDYEAAAAEIHRRYAWMTFADGKERNVLFTVKRWKNPETDEDSLYAVEALEVVEPGVYTSWERSGNPDPPIPPGSGDTLSRFLAGIKPEHRGSAAESQDQKAKAHAGANEQTNDTRPTFDEELINRAVEEAIARGNIANTDDVRPLLDGYKEADPLTRDSQFHRQASALNDLVIQRLLARKPVTRVAIVLAGGGGSGKSSVLKRLGLQWDAVIDTTLSWEESARQLISDIEASGRTLFVPYVHRPFANSFEEGVIRRYLKGKEEGNPRLVPLRVAAEAHVGAQETAIALAEAGVRVSVFDNSGSAGQFVERDIEFLKQNRYTTANEGRSESGTATTAEADTGRSSSSILRSDGESPGGNRAGLRGGTADHGRDRGEVGRKQAAIDRLIAEGDAIIERFRREGKLTDAEARAFRGEGGKRPDESTDGDGGEAPSDGDGGVSFSITPSRARIPENFQSGSDGTSKPTEGIASNAADPLDKNPNSNYDSTDERRTDNERAAGSRDSRADPEEATTPRRGKEGVRDVLARAKAAGVARLGRAGAEFEPLILGKEGVLKIPTRKGLFVFNRKGETIRSADIEAARQKAMLIEALGGFPTEVIENDDGSFTVYQDYGDEITKEEYERLVVPILDQRPNAWETWDLELGGKTYRIGDLHWGNFRKDKNGDIRITDLIGGEIDPD